VLVETQQDAREVVVQDPELLAFVSQTTLSVDDTADIINILIERFPSIVGPRKNDICYATQNRQDAVKSLAKECDVVLVVGSTNSSNSNRLAELAQQCGVDAYLIDGAEEIKEEWLHGKLAVGVTAGASAPEVLVESVVEKLSQFGGEVIQMPGPAENVAFALPAGLSKVSI
jgi:4-hydroxy-3-methylbut-2-enyl diphosphate reductase